MNLQSATISSFQSPHPGMYGPSTSIPQRVPARAPDAVERIDDRLEVPIHELSFVHLRATDEIGRIVHLRQQIQLPASALADPEFHTREKKETKSAS